MSSDGLPKWQTKLILFAVIALWISLSLADLLGYLDQSQCPPGSVEESVDAGWNREAVVCVP